MTDDGPPPLDQARDAHTRALRVWLVARGDAEPPARAALDVARNHLRRAELLDRLQRHPHVERNGQAWRARQRSLLRTGHYLRKSQR